jgi:hypothetical protein
MTLDAYAECFYAECHLCCRHKAHCAECRYAECHCAECRSALMLPHNTIGRHTRSARMHV